MSKNFGRYSEFYDLLYSEKNYNKEAEYIDAHIKRLIPTANDLLELGSGTGNHAAILSKKGYHITGVERSKEMIDISLSKAIDNFEPINADMSSFEVPRQFDVAIALFHSICYLTSNDDLLRCFTSVYRHLKPSSVFCFDFWYGPGVIHSLPGIRVKKLSDDRHELIRLAQTEMFIEKNVAVVDYELIVRDKASGEYANFREQHPMRYFSLPEIELICNQTGFKLVTSETFLDSGALDLDAWNGFCIAQRVD